MPPSPPRTPQLRSRAGRGRPTERLIAVLVFPGVTLLDVAGPLQVLTRLDRPYRTVLVASRLHPVATDTPILLNPHHAFAELPEPQVLVVPGGGLGVVRAMVDPAVQAYLEASARSAGLVGSVCTGSILLASAGLLEGRRAATHWGYATLLQRLGARYRHARCVEDGPFVTAAASIGGAEMALRLVARLTDDATSMRIGAALAIERRATARTPDADAGHGGLLGHLPRAEALGRLASMRLILAERPDLLQRLAL